MTLGREKRWSGSAAVWDREQERWDEKRKDGERGRLDALCSLLADSEGFLLWGKSRWLDASAWIQH